LRYPSVFTFAMFWPVTFSACRCAWTADLPMSN